MNAIDTHRVALKWAADLLEMVMADVTDEQVHWRPPGTANPVAAQYAHAVCAADAAVHTFLQGKPALFESTWADRTGISQPQMRATPEWAQSVTVELESARSYARAVYQALDDHVASLTDENLAVEHDLTQSGLGKQTVDWILSALVTSHINNMAGEISCLKGIQGGKGYPF